MSSRVYFLIFTCFNIIFFFIPLSSAQVTAERLLPTQGYLPEQNIIVEITVQGESGDLFSVTETPPVGWKVSTVNSRGSFNNGVIQWTQLLLGTMPRVLSSWLTVPANADGIQHFTGTINNQTVTGDYTLEPHTSIGTIEHHWIDSVILKNANQNSKRELTVYLPEDYSIDERKYPVLYLLHGHMGSNRTFFGNGYPYYNKLINEIYIDTIVDQLIVNGMIQPQIVVLPDVYRETPLNDVFSKYLIEDVVCFVDQTYRTIQERESRMIGGHSYGGSDAMYMALENPNMFSLVGLYSAHFYGREPNVNVFANHDQQLFPLRFWISMGTKDEFTSVPPDNRSLVKILDELRLPYMFVEDDSDHWATVGQRIKESIQYFSKYAVFDESITGVGDWICYENVGSLDR